jgi:hypothetical protein
MLEEFTFMQASAEMLPIETLKKYQLTKNLIIYFLKEFDFYKRLFRKK